MAQSGESRSVVNLATGTDAGVLFFYRLDTGLATTGRLDSSGTYTDLRNHNLDRGWHQILPLQNGLVLFNHFARSGFGDLVAGRVLPDGSYQDLRTNVAFGYAAQLVGISDNV